jgi:GNAT superfamily N-acetyltransferase
VQRLAVRPRVWPSVPDFRTPIRTSEPGLDGQLGPRPGRELATVDQQAAQDELGGLAAGGLGLSVTNGATFAWAWDVFVGPAARGQGIGSALLASLCADLAPLNSAGSSWPRAMRTTFTPSSASSRSPNPERWMSLMADPH